MSTLPRENTSLTEPIRVVRPAAVIDIGTSSIRMAIAEIDSAGGVRTLETLSQAVDLGKDTFTKGSIEKATIEKCVEILKSYRQRLREYQISRDDQIRVVATRAVRGAPPGKRSAAGPSSTAFIPPPECRSSRSTKPKSTGSRISAWPRS